MYEARRRRGVGLAEAVVGAALLGIGLLAGASALAAGAQSLGRSVRRDRALALARTVSSEVEALAFEQLTELLAPESSGCARRADSRDPGYAQRWQPSAAELPGGRVEISVVALDPAGESCDFEASPARRIRIGVHWQEGPRVVSVTLWRVRF